MSRAQPGGGESARQDYPRHIAIIMDGNGRWAVSRGKRRTAGHQAGTDSVQAVTEACIALGIDELTLYAFSTENWRRPRTEVNFLMRMLRSYLAEHRRKMLKDDVRLAVFGDVDGLPKSVQDELSKTIKATSRCGKLRVNLALNYGSHQEIARAARLIAAEVARGSLEPEDVDVAAVEERLYTAGHPMPDLIIRTAGEVRLSNFLLWQSSYSELYFTPVLWPDFRRIHLEEAIEDYLSRKRRFGGLDKRS